MQPASSADSVKVGFQRILQEHGPAMDNGDTLMVRSVTSLRSATRARRAPEKSNRVAPSLHFKASAGEMWSEILENMMNQGSSIKPRRVASSTSSSTRRIRRLPQSKGATESLNLESIYRTGGGFCSRFRQLATETTAKFPGTACDVPLSSVYIQWMIPAESLDRAPNNEPQCDSVADYNIYFDVAEYEHNFAAIMQNYATSAAMDEASATFPINQAALASARRSLREISAIFERTREQKEGHSADTIFASRSNPPSRSKHFDSFKQSQEPGVFARASVLQLVQTRYYSKRFLPLMHGEDVDALRKLYPSALFGEGCISTLYVSVVAGLRDKEEQRDAKPRYKVFMHPLTDEALHELLLVYVARGRRGVGSGVLSNQWLTSLACSDAINTLLPCRQKEGVGSSFCVIKNPRGLWKLSKETGKRDPEDFESFTDADIVFAECTVSSTQVGRFGCEQRESRKTHSLLETLGSSCLWRSCLTHDEFQGIKNSANLCRWHASIQRFLGFDESMQYTPNETRMKESLLIVESDSLVERIKHVIQTSSSLLEELSSGHLPHSIKAFYYHVASAASNRVYQAELLGTAALAEVTNGSPSICDLEQCHNELQRLVDVSEEILGTENRATRELQQLLQLTVYPGVENSFVQQGFFDLEELESDIRTRDPELLLRLSQQKLQILMRRRKDEEKQVIRRLGPSASLSTMSCHSSLEQARWNDPELATSSVEDVIHVMRKGRQSLTRQQRQEAQNGGQRHGSKRDAQPSHSLERSASDLAYRVSPYEARVVLAAKCRVNGGTNNKKVVRKYADR
ncbi:hypothetical protein V7S43_018236 [Phytophthora oleae]